MNFEQAQEYLDSLQMHKIKLGLESMENFLAKVDRPEEKLKFVHVAGTNGKGSVSINIVTILAQAGYRVGLFTSPHLSSVRERFRINTSYISEAEFARHASTIREVLGRDMITYFEFTTALALLWFADSEVDLVVLETGMGGRLDATNVVSPLVSVITNVSMDHEIYLGNDLASIAGEKAGIIKPGVPLVTGVAEDVSLEIVTHRCREVGTKLYRYGSDFITSVQPDGSWQWHGCEGFYANTALRGLRCGMKGSYQIANSSLAIGAALLLQDHGFAITEEDIRNGLAAVLWPGRLEHIQLQRKGENDISSDNSHALSLNFLIDGAHNPAGVASLVATLRYEYTYNRLIVIWGAMEDKDLSRTILPIAELAAMIILTKPPGERAATPRSLLDVIPQQLHEICHQREKITDALKLAEKHAEETDLVLVAGSLYLIGEVRKILVGELAE